MAVRIRPNGQVLCAAMHPELPGDLYVDDSVHYDLSVRLGLLVTEPWDSGGMGGHQKHGEWWWRGLAPAGATLEIRA